MSWTIPVGFLAIILVALCLVPAGAHLAELPGKMALSADEYMTVQKIYAGWSMWGFAIFAAMAATLIHTVLVWREPAVFWLSLASFLALAATQAIFWLYTFPMNMLTRNWTVTPENLDLARRQWEYSHAVNALITFAAFVLITTAVLRGGDRKARASARRL
jgi:hypothetical protein